LVEKCYDAAICGIQLAFSVCQCVHAHLYIHTTNECVHICIFLQTITYKCTDIRRHRYTETAKKNKKTRTQILIGIQAHRQTDTQTNRHTDTQTHRHEDTRTRRHAQTHRHIQTHEDTNRQTQKYTDTHDRIYRKKYIFLHPTISGDITSKNTERRGEQ